MLRREMATSKTLSRDGCTLAWESLGRDGDADRAPGVLLHGFGTTRDAMRPLAEALLARRTWDRALLADARGHGQTRTPARDDAYGYPAMRDDCLALLAHAAPDGAHLVGHSMGGQIALMVALARPDLVRSLCLVGAGPCRKVVREKERRSWERAAAAFETGGPEDLVRSLAAAAPSRDPRLHPARIYAGACGEQLARVVRGGFLTVDDNDAACAQLATPTLLIAGDLDAGWLEPTRKLAGLVQGATLRIFEEAGHLVHLERSDACADAIAAFVAEHP